MSSTAEGTAIRDSRFQSASGPSVTSCHAQALPQDVRAASVTTRALSGAPRPGSCPAAKTTASLGLCRRLASAGLVMIGAATG
jgi:hypothetical protein